MECESCNDLLIDYLYDDLDELRRAAVRRHLDGCSACDGAFERLSRGRSAARSLAPVAAPLPNAALIDAIEAAAGARSAGLRGGHGASVATALPTESRARFPVWMRRVGEVAMRRQVAMAAVFLLMIGFGLSYHQPQAPTRPVQTSDEPGAQVIPATELPAAEAPMARDGLVPSGRRPPTARPVVAERVIEHRGPSVARPLSGSLEGSAGAVPVAPAAPAGADVDSADNVIGQQALPHAERGAASQESPTAYRELQPPAAQAPGRVAGAQRVTGDTALDRALPRAPIGSTEQISPQSAYGGAQVAQQAAPTWRVLRDRGASFRARGDTDQAIVALRDALALDPPDADRTAIAQALRSLLLQSGQVREAGVVQARYLAQPNETSVLAGEVNGPSQATAAASSRPAVSRPMPSRAAPTRSRRVPAQSDSFNNLGF